MKNLSTILMLNLAVLLAGYQTTLWAAETPDAKMQVAQEMVQAWNDQNWDKVYDLFAEDGVLHSMMIDPIVGRENIRVRLGKLTAGISQIELQLRNSGVINGQVFLERVDDFTYNGKRGQVPVVGVMEISNGKVDIWREYYDHETLAKALKPDPKPMDEVLAESETEIRAIIEKLQVDWNGGDMSAYLAAYWNDEEFSLMFGDKAVRGWQVVSDMFTSTWTTEEAMGNFQTSDVAVRFTGTDIAIASGGFKHVFPTETIVGSFTHVMRRFDDGRWLIIHEHTSRANTH